MRFNGLRILVASICLVGLFAVSCSAPGPTPIRYGEDNCDYCRMTIVNHLFGAELVTTKGKVYKFDSIECLSAFDGRGDIDADQVHSSWVTDYHAPDSLISIAAASFVQTEHARSPMGMGLFGFSSDTSARAFAENVTGSVMSWDSVVELVSRVWLED